MPCSSRDSVIFNGCEEYRVIGKGNVQISFGGKMLIFLNVYYFPSMELNLLSVNQIMWHIPQLNVNFSNHRCYIFDKETKKIVALGVEDHEMFRLVDIGQVIEQH
jgi:hypothetical protein